jgi:hypothetical protein
MKVVQGILAETLPMKTLNLASWDTMANLENIWSEQLGMRRTCVPVIEV